MTEGGVNSSLEALGTIDRAKVPGRRERSAKRRFKGGERDMLRELARTLKHQDKLLATIDS